MPATKNLEKLSAGELKSRLKEIGMSQAGDKGTLLHRCKLYEKCVSKSLSIDNENPCLLKVGDLRKSVAKCGLSPIGSQDELLASLVDHLEKTVKTSTESTTATSASDKDVKSSNNINPIAIARKILELDEYDDHEGILSIAVGSGGVTKLSPIAVMRKAYLKLSLLVHPDKLGSQFENATKAFQALVRAFERLSEPDISLEETTTETTDKRKTKKSAPIKTISRSNEGCYRTRVCCPRCRQPWSEGTLDGNPNYFYNFFMSGLKQYTCSTCLFEFGCVTAIHKCPFCHKSFEYSPQDYHRKISCGHSNCTKPFGFYLYPTSDRVLKDMKKEVKDEQERRAKTKESKQRRAARHRVDDVEEEKAFLLGLVDSCPRCGESLEEYDDEAQRRHLSECTDTDKHMSHAKRKAKAAEKEVKKQKRVDAQESVQARAAWEFLGAQTNQLWLLDDTQLRNQALEAGLPLSATDDRNDMISALASHRHEKDDLLRTATGNSTDMVTAPKKYQRRMTPESVPSNLHSMELKELLGVCAAHGFKPVGTTKSQVLAEIEDELCSEVDEKHNNKEVVKKGNNNLSENKSKLLMIDLS